MAQLQTQVATLATEVSTPSWCEWSQDAWRGSTSFTTPRDLLVHLPRWMNQLSFQRRLTVRETCAMLKLHRYRHVCSYEAPRTHS